jgi:hypothetical protein
MLRLPPNAVHLISFFTNKNTMMGQHTAGTTGYDIVYLVASYAHVSQETRIQNQGTGKSRLFNDVFRTTCGEGKAQYHLHLMWRFW